MRLSGLLRFRQIEGGGSIPDDVLAQLDLPMPPDVLEQFISDHGTKEEFQLQYRHLDLHAVAWRLTPVTAREFLAASMFERFRDWTETVTGRTRVVPQEGWGDVLLPRGAAGHWQSHGTWLRPPVTLRAIPLK